MKKLCTTLFTTFCVAATSLSAASCPPPCPPAPCSPCEIDFCDWGGFDGTFTVYGDWLYWRTRRCDLDIAMEGTIDPQEGTPPLIGDVINLRSKYESGYRIGAYYTTQTGMTLGARYTRFENNFGSFYESENPFLKNRPHPSLMAVLFSKDALYSVDYDLVNVEFGIALPLSGTSKVRAFATTNFASIDEKLDTMHVIEVLGAEPPDGFIGVAERNDIRAWGVGVGLELQREVFCGLGIYARTTFSLMYGDYKMYHTERSGALQDGVPSEELSLVLFDVFQKS